MLFSSFWRKVGNFLKKNSWMLGFWRRDFRTFYLLTLLFHQKGTKDYHIKALGPPPFKFRYCHCKLNLILKYRKILKFSFGFVFSSSKSKLHISFFWKYGLLWRFFGFFQNHLATKICSFPNFDRPSVESKLRKVVEPLCWWVYFIYGFRKRKNIMRWRWNYFL